MTDQVTISKFNICIDGPPKTHHVIGKRATGKTELIKVILRKIRRRYNNVFVLVFSDLACCRDEYGSLVDDVQPCEMDKVSAYTQRFEQVAQNARRAAPPSTYDPHFVMIFSETLTSQREFKRSEVLQRLVMNHRHFNTTLIFEEQYCEGWNPAIRANEDYVYMFRDRAVPNVRKLWQYYGSIVGTFDRFRRLFDAITDSPYTCLVVDNTTTSNEISDALKWYKASLRDPVCVWHYIAARLLVRTHMDSINIPQDLANLVIQYSVMI